MEMIPTCTCGECRIIEYLENDAVLKTCPKCLDNWWGDPKEVEK